jgi:hypothetical protein
MKAPQLQLRREDYPDLEGDRLDRLLRQLTTFGTQIHAALNRGITFGENLAAQVKEVTVKTRDPWLTPTLENGWVDYGGSQAEATYRKGGGEVLLRGTVKSGTMAQPIFTLPAGYRPAATIGFGVVSSAGAGDAFGSVLVNAAGQVVPVAGGNTWLYLDEVRFWAADPRPIPNPCFPVSVDLSLPGNRRPEFVIAKAIDTETGAPVAMSLPAWSASVSASTGAYVLKLHDVPGLTPLRTYKLTLLVIGG